jgi:hypothetical protein
MSVGGAISFPLHFAQGYPVVDFAPTRASENKTEPIDVELFLYTSLTAYTDIYIIFYLEPPFMRLV